MNVKILLPLVLSVLSHALHRKKDGLRITGLRDGPECLDGERGEAPGGRDPGGQ